MNKPKFTKRLNCLAILLLFVFTCSISYCYYTLCSKTEILNYSYNSILKDVSIAQHKYKLNTSETEFTQTDEPIFSNGLDALLSAYEEYSKKQDVEVSINGTIIANARITSYTMEIQGFIKKTNGTVQSSINVYCASSPDKNSGSLAIFENDTIIEKKTKKVSKTNGTLVPDFTTYTQKVYSSSEYKNERGIYPGELFYTLNSKSITEISNFYIKKNLHGNITGYNTNFNLSPNLSTTKYIKTLSCIIEGSKNYTFSMCNGSIELNENGNLKTMNTSEIYSFDFNLFGDAYWRVECTSNMSFVLNV